MKRNIRILYYKIKLPMWFAREFEVGEGNDMIHKQKIQSSK